MNRSASCRRRSARPAIILYAVVTDGRLFLGLHGRAMPAPALTFVMPRLMHGIEQLEQLGIEFEDLQLGNEVFNRVSFRGPSGQCVERVRGAHIFAAASSRASRPATCGYFTEYGLPVARAGPDASGFWKPSASWRWDEQPEPFALYGDHQ